MNDRIEFLTHEPFTIPVQHDDVFAVNQHRKAVWLQKICIWILRKLGCEWTEITTKYRRVAISPSSFMQELCRQRAEIISRFDGDPAVLLIGAEDFEKMMNTEEFGRLFSFTGEYLLDRRIFGLSVHVVPYMRGMVVLDSRDIFATYKTRRAIS